MRPKNVIHGRYMQGNHESKDDWQVKTFDQYTTNDEKIHIYLDYYFSKWPECA